MKIQSFLLKGSIPLSQAMNQLDKTAKKVLFVVDDEGKLVAALTDGDIRRFLLKGGTLSDPVIAAANHTPKFLFDTQASGADAFMKDKKIDAVPIVDEKLIVHDIAFLDHEVDLSQLKIRSLEKKDRDIILAFFDQMAGDTRAMFNRGDVNLIRVIDYLDGKDVKEEHFIATVVENGAEKVVGYVFLWDTDKRIPWFGICVHEAWKGRHMGRILLKYLDDWCLKGGYGGLLLTTVPANIRAQSLYTRMGYEFLGNHVSGEFLYLKRFDV